jgi:photosystem II stability/assembly factor-like uncharacterized protein
VGKIFAATLENGIYTSSDGGKTWAERNAGLSSKMVLAIAAKYHEMVFAGTYGGGVFRTADGDASSWVPVNVGLGAAEVTCLRTGPNGGLYAGTSTGDVYYSTNDGETWTRIASLNEYVMTLAIADGFVLAGTSHGVYRSVDHGKTWQDANAGLGCRDVWSITVSANKHVFAATNGGGVFRSTDGGAGWVPSNDGLECKNVGSVAVCPTGRVLIGTTRGIFVSSNDGETWTRFPADGTEGAVRCLCVGINGQLLVGSQWVDVLDTNPVQPIPEEQGEFD